MAGNAAKGRPGHFLAWAPAVKDRHLWNGTLQSGIDILLGCLPRCYNQRRVLLVQVNINASCNFVKDVLRGDDVSEMRLKLLSQKSEVYPYTEDD